MTAQSNPPRPRLLAQVRNAIRVLHMARSMEKAYVDWTRQFILFHDKRHSKETGNAEVSRFLTHLAVERHVPSSTQNQAAKSRCTLMKSTFIGVWRQGLVTQMPAGFRSPGATARRAARPVW
jgi:hypothetical protein